MPAAWQQHAQALQLETAQLAGFPSMVMTDNDDMYLASVKAVTEAYPLRGELQLSSSPFGDIVQAAGVPAPGEVWLAPRLFSLLNVGIGDTVWVGEAKFVITAAIRSEPDGTSALFGYGPRLLMNLSDLPATGVIQPGSRINYRLLLAGDELALDDFIQWLEPQLVQGQRLLGLDASQPSIERTLDRARGFLLLAGSLGVVLAASAIALAARRFSERHADHVAVMKSCGATGGRISRLYGSSLLLLGAVAALLGCVLGWLIQALFYALFGEQMGISAGGTGVEPYVVGATTAAVCLICFAWPPLLRLSQVPPLRVLRRDVGGDLGFRWWDTVSAAAATIGLMWWYSKDATLTAGVVGGLAVTVTVGFVMAKGLLYLGLRIGGSAGSIWRLAMAGLVRRGNANAMQMVIFAVAIMLLLVLAIVRTSLLSQWQAQLPEGTPNHFLLNIAPEQQTAIARALMTQGVAAQPMFPMTRGRVMAVNGEPLAAPEQVDAERRQREANFTSMTDFPEANTLLEGQWWPPGSTQSEVSLEQSFAERIGASVGDEITVTIGADEFDARVTSVRESDWQSMKPNFFVIFPKAVLASYPQTFLTSFFLPRDKKRVLNDFVREFPTTTIIELDIVIDEIRTVVDRVAQAIELVLAVILLAGSLVLVAGVQASVDTRLRESALLRALGAGRQLLLGALAIEFVTLGAFAGTLAILGAETAAWGIQTQALDLSYRASPWLWPVALLVGGVMIGGLGVWSCRHAVRVPPLVVLRET